MWRADGLDGLEKQRGKLVCACLTLPQKKAFAAAVTGGM
jgi:hypothetical protein